MSAYGQALDGNGTTMVLTPDSEFFRFFRSPDGGTPNRGATVPPASSATGSTMPAAPAQ